MSSNRPIRLWSIRLAAVGAVVIAILGYASTFVVSYDRLFRADDPFIVTDVARLSQARVTRIDAIRGVEDIRAALLDAARSGLHVSIAGSGHSQGGQTYADNAIVLDMRGFKVSLSR
jgi:decaprenylphospho-beta-D-ribofuranose 2-oxidase